MAKIAELHNGTQIHFPDDMPDHEMDAAVQRHLGVVDPDVTSTFMKALSMHAKTLADVKSGVQNTELKAKKEEQQRDVEHKTHIIAQAAHVEATNGVAKSLQDGLTALLGPISGLADASEEGLPQLVLAVDNLSATITHAVKALVAALMLPKELQTDSKGRPRGIFVVKGDGQ